MEKPRMNRWGQLVVAATFIVTCNWYQSQYDIYGKFSKLLQPKLTEDLSTGEFQLKPANQDEEKDEVVSKIELELKKQRQVASTIKLQPRSQGEIDRDLKMEMENRNDPMKIRLIKAD